MLRTKLEAAKSKILGVGFGVSAAVSTALTNVYCTGADPTIGGFTVSTVNIGSNLNANTIASKIVGLLCAAIALVGMLSLINGYSDYTSAKKDENATGQTKAANKMAISLLEIAAPVVVAFIFT